MAYTKPLDVSFSSSYSGLSTVGYQLIDSDGDPSGSRITAGVIELAAGSYGAIVTIPDGFEGWIAWDTGGIVPVYATEAISGISFDLTQVIAMPGAGDDITVAQALQGAWGNGFGDWEQTSEGDWIMYSTDGETPLARFTLTIPSSPVKRTLQ